MSDELKKAINDLLTTLTATVKEGVEQIPLVLQEKLAYEFWRSAVVLGTCTILLCFGILTFWFFRRVAIAHRLERDYRKDEYTEDGNFIFGSVALALSFIVWLFAAIGEGTVLLKITLAPRVYILDWLRGLV